MPTTQSAKPAAPGFGAYGAQGMTGGQALARTLDAAAGYGMPSVRTKSGVIVCLRYLTWGRRGNDWLRTAGIQVTDRTIARWKEGTQFPREANRRKIEQALWLCRRSSLADHYKQRLWDNGRGSRIEVYPVDQTTVALNRSRDLRMRHFNVRTEWAAIVDAWSANDHARLDEVWESMTYALGSDHDAYTHVSHLGFGV
ncbi:transcriptional regulator [Streptomyces albidoflavus]|uniref:transcriptional regulator n=2 Tax=Streptomyces sp. N1 TaxID=576456 RepID=UPI001010D256|nr:transcriptional regulator [Streptomyces sp. N1]